MHSKVTSLLLAVLLSASACSSAGDGEFIPPQAPAATTTTVVASAPTDPGGSSIADLVVPGASALYDPADHVDTRSAPVWISIDGIGVESAPIVGVGVEASGDLEVPGADAVGWYRFNPEPGGEGSSVLAAHIAYDGSPGVFRHLANVEVGAIVRIGFDDGSSAAFEIVELAQYDKQELPSGRIFAKTGDPVLTLITCGGSFNQSLRSYDDNVVAYAVPLNAAKTDEAG